jgi:hypothetical protein
MKRVILIAAFTLAPIMAFAQSKAYEEQVFLDRLDKSSNTYSGRIIIKVTLCGKASYSDVGDFDKATTIITFDKAESSEDAKAQKQADIDRFISGFAKDPGLCPPH